MISEFLAGELDIEFVKHQVALLKVLAFGVGLDVGFNLLDGKLGVGLVEIIFGTGLIDRLDAAEEGIFGVFGVGVASDEVFEVESSHVVVAVLIVGIGEEVEDSVGLRGTQGEGIELFKKTGGGEPLVVVVEL